MAALNSKRGASILVYAIIGIIIAVVFFTFAANLIGGFLDEFPKVSGSVTDTSKVVCFGGGKDNSIHCLEKLTGEPLFTFEKAKKWKKGGADSTPKLTKEGLYFAIGNHVCAYNPTGAIWNNCYEASGSITTDIEANFGLVCFGTDRNEYTCLNQRDGSQILTIKAKEKCLSHACTTLVKPIVTEDYIYVGLGHKVCKYDKFSSGPLDETASVWGRCIGFSFDTSNIELKNDLMCFGAGNNNLVACFNATAGDPIFNSLTKAQGFAGSKPHLEGDLIYFALGNKLYKWNISQDELLELVDFGIVSSSINTDFAANDEVICFGSGDNDAIRCSEKNELASGFFVSASDKWDATDAKSTPAIDNGLLYFALGDHVCAYDIALAKSASNHIVGESSAQKWCADPDFDYQINSGIAVLENE